MGIDISFLQEKLKFLEKELLQEIAETSLIKSFSEREVLVKEGKYIKQIPFVLSGLVKVFTQFEDKELLLYYIKPKESCIMSFASCLQNQKSKIHAIVEEESLILLMPSEKVLKWILSFPTLNSLFYRQYELRYTEMIDTIHHLIYFKLDKRLSDYLHAKVMLLGINKIKITHKEIAHDLGTAREVISRLLKKMEKEKVIIQHSDGIEIIHIL